MEQKNMQNQGQGNRGNMPQVSNVKTSKKGLFIGLGAAALATAGFFGVRAIIKKRRAKKEAAAAAPAAPAGK